MSEARFGPVSSRIIRWIARIWSLLIFAFVIFRIVTPDPSITEPVPFVDWFLLSLWGIAILGVLVAWRWENVGAIITIGIMFLREVAWVVLKGRWIVNFLIVWALVVPPVILFLIARRIEERARS
jgi:hypothetical protein